MASEASIIWPPGSEPERAVVHARNIIEIAAPAGRIWSLLVDCTAWPAWYPRCSDVSMLSSGSRLDGVGATFRFKTLGFYFEPKVVTFEVGRTLVWTARGPAGTSGSHAWSIEPSPSGQRVRTEETQRGALLRLAPGRARRNLHHAHEIWLESLKRMAEA